MKSHTARNKIFHSNGLFGLSEGVLEGVGVVDAPGRLVQQLQLNGGCYGAAVKVFQVGHSDGHTVVFMRILHLWHKE